MSKVLYLKSEILSKRLLETQPDVDFGFDFGYKNYNGLTVSGDDITDMISIDTMISTLQELKSEGCNYVTFVHNSDHAEYEVSGASIRVATTDEVEDIEKENDIRKAKLKRISELRTEMDNLVKTL